MGTYEQPDIQLARNNTTKLELKAFLAFGTACINFTFLLVKCTKKYVLDMAIAVLGIRVVKIYKENSFFKITVIY